MRMKEKEWGRETETETEMFLLSATIALVKGLETFSAVAWLDCSDILLGAVWYGARDGEDWSVVLIAERLKNRSSSSFVAEKHRENKKERKEGKISKHTYIHTYLYIYRNIFSMYIYKYNAR